MGRQTDNWIMSYLRLVNDTEPPIRYHTWTAITMLASLLGRKCEMEFGPEIIHPNLYTILTGPPGVRKGSAIKYGVSLLKELGGSVMFTANVVTRQQFYGEIEACQAIDYLPSGEPFIHSSLFVVSDELVMFLEEKDTRRLADLCDLYDGKPVFEYKTKKSGHNYAVNPSLWILAGTTPNWIQVCMPQLAAGGGMTSRTIFVVAEKKGKHIPLTKMRSFDPVLTAKLVSDMAEIKAMCGRFTVHSAAATYYEEWYEKVYPYLTGQVKDERLKSYVERLPLMVTKVAMVIAASKRDDMIVYDRDVAQAVQLFNDIQIDMHRAFGGFGTSVISAQTYMVKDMIRERGAVARSEILSRLDMHISNWDLSRIMETLLMSKYCKPATIDNETFYVYKEVPKECPVSELDTQQGDTDDPKSSDG